MYRLIYDFVVTCNKIRSEVIKLEFILKLKIKRNNGLLVDVSTSSPLLRFILSLRMNSSFIATGPGSICDCAIS